MFWKCCLLFTSAEYMQVHFRLVVFMEANNMNPDQTDCSDPGPYCLEYRLPKKISRWEKQTRKVVIGRLRVYSSVLMLLLLSFSLVRDLLHVYLNRCEFHFLRLHINKPNKFCFLINWGTYPWYGHIDKSLQVKLFENYSEHFVSDSSSSETVSDQRIKLRASFLLTVYSWRSD